VISRIHRFHGRASLRRHHTQSKSVRSAGFALKYVPTDRSAYRLAVIVSRKVSKSAVVRNRIRRRIYENVRILYDSLLEPNDIVVVVYDESVAAMPTEDLRQEIVKLCKKAQLAAAEPVQHAIVESKE
jgi:ribonuclease P protein component